MGSSEYSYPLLEKQPVACSKNIVKWNGILKDKESLIELSVNWIKEDS